MVTVLPLCGYIDHPFLGLQSTTANTHKHSEYMRGYSNEPVLSNSDGMEIKS